MLSMTALGIRLTIAIVKRPLPYLLFRCDPLQFRVRIELECCMESSCRAMTETTIHIPRLYAILDAVCFPDANAMFTAAEELTAAGCTLLQYRNKSGSARHMLD